VCVCVCVCPIQPTSRGLCHLGTLPRAVDLEGCWTACSSCDEHSLCQSIQYQNNNVAVVRGLCDMLLDANKLTRTLCCYQRREQTKAEGEEKHENEERRWIARNAATCDRRRRRRPGRGWGRRCKPTTCFGGSVSLLKGE
jgi:hypothetical protein